MTGREGPLQWVLRRCSHGFVKGSAFPPPLVPLYPIDMPPSPAIPWKLPLSPVMKRSEMDGEVAASFAGRTQVLVRSPDPLEEQRLAEGEGRGPLPEGPPTPMLRSPVP